MRFHFLYLLTLVATAPLRALANDYTLTPEEQKSVEEMEADEKNAKPMDEKAQKHMFDKMQSTFGEPPRDDDSLKKKKIRRH